MYPPSPPPFFSPMASSRRCPPSSALTFTPFCPPFSNRDLSKSLVQDRKAGRMPSRGGEEAPKPASAAAKGYDDELHATADGNIGAAAAAAAVGAASAKRANSAASTPRTPQKQLLPSRPSSSSKSKKDEHEEELPLDPNRVPSPAPLEDEEFDVAAAAAAAARSDAVLFPDEASRKRRSGSSSDDDDDGGEDGLRKRPTGGDGESSTDEDEGYRGAGDSHVGSRSGFLSFVDETREMRNPARSAADADARKKRRAEEKRKEKASAAKVAAPEQPKRGELVHAGRGQQQGGAEQEAAAAAEAEEEQGTTAPASKRAKNPSSRPPPPSSSFEAAGLSPSTAAHLRSLGFARPTPVQASAMPALCSGRDALVRAPTGSGKTLAYLAPIVDAVSGARACASSPSSSIASRGARALGSRAIVLAPTRELALQVTDVAAALTKRYHWVVGGALYGERGFCLFSPPPVFSPHFFSTWLSSSLSLSFPLYFPFSLFETRNRAPVLTALPLLPLLFQKKKKKQAASPAPPRRPASARASPCSSPRPAASSTTSRTPPASRPGGSAGWSSTRPTGSSTSGSRPRSRRSSAPWSGAGPPPRTRRRGTASRPRRPRPRPIPPPPRSIPRRCRRSRTGSRRCSCRRRWARPSRGSAGSRS